MNPDTVQLDDGRIVPLQSDEGGRWLASQPEAYRNDILAYLGNRASSPNVNPTSQPDYKAPIANAAASYGVHTAGKAGLESIAGASRAAPFYIPAAVGLSTLLTGKAALEQAQGGKPQGYGRAQLGVATGGLSEIARLFSGGHSTHNEEDRRAELAKRGINVPNAGVKEWENNKAFADSRDESTLTGKDIIHAAQLYDLPGYAQASAAQQEAIANEALKRQLVREHHGGVDVNADESFNEFVKNQLAAAPVTAMSSGGKSGGGSKTSEEAKKEKQPKLDLSLARPTSYSPRYDIDLSPIYTNPYL